MRNARIGWLVVVGWVILAGCGSTVPEDAPREAQEYTIQEFLETTTYYGRSFSPDGSRLLLTTDASGVYNVYSIPTDGGDLVQLTHSDTESIFNEDYFPNDERFLYSADEGGNELDHLFVQDLDGNVTDLTPGDGLKAGFLQWTADGTGFFVETNERDERFFDLYRYDSDDYDRTLVFKNDDGFEIVAVSRDERWVALQRPVTTSVTEAWLHDLRSGETTRVSPEGADGRESPDAFSPDGSWLYFTTNVGSEFSRLVRYELAGGTREEVLDPGWDIRFARFSKGGNYLTVSINDDARTVIQVYRYPSMERVELADFPDGDITSIGFSADESTMAYYVSSGRSPRDLFVQAVAGGDPKRLTRSLNPAIAADDLVEPEVVRFASYDGLEIPGLLYRPHRANPETPVPALVWVHGGPGGQSRVGYRGQLQYLVNHGYAVYAINNRGSSGYGKSFFRMDDRKHGEADLGDVVAAKQMLIDTGWVDADRIGIIGGSYGGYMVLAALAYEPEVFAVGVDIFGVSNWLRTMTSIPPYWESFRKALYDEMGDPAEDEDRLRRISPLFHAENIVRPLMVLQGANDPRVLQVESDEIVAAVKANGVPVEYLVFDDEGHGFAKKANRERGYKAILEFLDTYMTGASSGG